MPPANKKRSGRVRLVAASTAAGRPVLGRPTLQQEHALVAEGLAGSAPIGRTPQEREFEKFVAQLISSSPERRTMSKKDLVVIGSSQFGLSARRAGAIREHVIRLLHASAWSESGAPRGARRRR